MKGSQSWLRILVALLVLGIAAIARSEEIPISPTLEGSWLQIHYSTAVASDGRDFLVVFANASTVWFQRVDAAGTPLDSQPRRLGPFIGALSAEWDGRRYVVATSGARSLIHFVSSSGEVERNTLELEGYVRELVGFDDGVAIVAQQIDGLAVTFYPNGSGPLYIGKFATTRRNFLGVAKFGADWLFVWYEFRSESPRYQIHVTSAATGETTAGVIVNHVPLFSPSRSEGGLAVVHDGARLYGSTLRPDRTFAERFPIGESGIAAAEIEWLVRDAQGWRLRYGTRLARVRSGETVEDVAVRNAPPVRRTGIDYARAASTASVLEARGNVPGVPTYRIARDEYFVGPTLAIGDAAQRGGAVASNGEVSLIVWSELNRSGGTLRATRVDAGYRPLDGTGILIAHSASQMVDVEWDGENFIVAWTSFENETWMAHVRLIGTDGTFQSEAVRLDGSFHRSFDLATRGGGQSLFVGVGSFPNVSLLAVPLSHGVPGRAKVVGDERYPASHVLVEGGKDGYLMAWTDPFGCNTLCPPPSNRTFLRRLDRNGVPTEETRIFSALGGTSPWALLPNPLSAWTLAMSGPRGAKLVSLDSELRVVATAATPPPWGTPVRDRSGILFSTEVGILRYSEELSVLDHRGELRPGRTLRDDSEIRVSILPRIVNEVPRLYLRVDRPVSGSGADIGVVREQSLNGRTEYRIVVQHRGGEIVNELRVLVSGLWNASLNVDGAPAFRNSPITIKGPFRPGDSHEIVVKPAKDDIEGSVWVLPDTDDPNAANNFVGVVPTSRCRGVRN